MPRQPVAAPPPAARPINLRTSARLVDDGLRWENGISFLPEPCDPGGSEDPCTGPEDVKGSGTAATVVEWEPYTIYSYDSCSYSLNDDLYTDLTARVRRALEAQTSHLVEQIFWTGTVDGIDFTATHPNVALTQAVAPNLGTEEPPTRALKKIDEMLIAALGGRRGMVHVPMQLMHFFMDSNLLVKNGNVWETVTGNTVVPGTGYPGTDPDGDNVAPLWIYGTSPVELRLSDIVIVPNTLEGAIDRDTNQIVVRAERLALAYWDLCAHVGVPVCLTDPGPPCGSES